MIGMLRGVLWEKTADKIILDVTGIGYEVTVPTSLNTILVQGSEYILYISMVVREDDMSLYGFATARDKDLFLKLTGVSGVGPKAAMALLSACEGAQLAQAIAQGNYTLLKQAPGIGLKTAQRLVLELKGKFDDRIWRESFAGADGETANEAQGDGWGESGTSGLDVLDSLIALGFSLVEAKEAWKTVREADKNASTEDQVRAALRLLAKGG